MRDITLIETLKAIPWFLELKPQQISALAAISSIMTIEAGNSIFCEGDRVDNIYIVLSGAIGMDMAVPTQGIVRIYTAEALDIIGWSKLTPVVRQRTASAIALQDSTLLVINGDALSQLCDDDVRVGYIIMRRLANVVASNLLTIKLQLMDLILQTSQSREIQVDENTL
ncbi:MAG: Crp/Fnr family transcriptional regulator [Bellilinea sp.]|jgi:CRP-like cAMP-binding protein